MKPKTANAVIMVLLTLVGLLSGVSAMAMVVGPGLPLAPEDVTSNRQDESVVPSQNQIVIIGGGESVPYVTTEDSRVEIAPLPLPTPPPNRTLSVPELKRLICVPQYSWTCAEALAVISCESEGQTAVIGDLGEIGIWQIHPIHKVGLDAYDPQKSTDFAYKLYSHREWMDWLGCKPPGWAPPADGPFEKGGLK